MWQPPASLFEKWQKVEEKSSAHLEDMGIAQAALNILAHALIALVRQRVPHVDGGMAIARAHDGRVPAVQVLYIARQRGHILHQTPVAQCLAAQLCMFSCHSIASGN